jgi:hypothetical protein
MAEYRVATFTVRVPLPDGVTLEQLRDPIRNAVRTLCNKPDNPLFKTDWNKVRVKSGEIIVIEDKPSSEGIHVALHAIDRYRERTGCKRSDSYIAEKLRDFFNRSVEVELKKRYAVKTIINHNFQLARYFQFDQWIMVVEFMNGRDTLRTIHDGQAKRWQLKG